MADLADVKHALEAGRHDEALVKLYSASAVLPQRKRMVELLNRFGEAYGENRDIAIYSVPGRTEIGGNHTDHNNGLVMAAAVNLDIIAVVSPNGAGVIRLRSVGFEGEDAIKLDNLEIDPSEFGRSSALIRGVAAGFVQRGVPVEGLDIYTTSDVLKGSGLSSSAAFEVCVGTLLNHEFAAARFSPEEIAVIGRFAENNYFGKPSGLMDQMACSVGGALVIDFENPENPVVTRIPFELERHGYCLVTTDTKGDHADLTPDYAAIFDEMAAVAAFFGKEVLRQVPAQQFYDNLARVRPELGDRAVLRAHHYYEECRRVPLMAQALEKDDFKAFLQLVIEGGNSSFEYNQNAYTCANPRHQGLSVALALSQKVLAGQGAWRLQGGGFAGTIQAFVPGEQLAGYCATLEAVFGKGACHVLGVRPVGGTAVVARS